jgi:hypothetical protein
VGVWTAAGVEAGALPSSVQGVEAAGTSEASGVSTGTSGVGVGVSMITGVETGALPSSVHGVEVAGTAVAVISEEQGVVEDAGPIVGFGISVLLVKAGALVGLKDKDAGRSKVAEGLGWSIPRLKPMLMPGRPILIPGVWEGTSVGMDAETAEVYSTGLVGAVWEWTSVGIEAETHEEYSTGFVGAT